MRTSPNDINWSSHSNGDVVKTGYLSRAAHRLVWYQGEVWALPGRNTSNLHYRFAEESSYASWTYSPGDVWRFDSKGIDIDPRHSYDAVVWNNKIWIFGGFTSSNGQSNDVWVGTK